MNIAFISYSRDDKSFAQQIAATLDRCDTQYFLDTADVAWGDPVLSSVKHGLTECSSVIVIVSPASLSSQWVPYEVGFSSALGKKILPFLTRSNLEMPAFLRSLHYKTELSEVEEYFGTIKPPATLRDEEIIQNVKNTNYLKELFVNITISGHLTPPVLSAFKCVLAADGFERPLATMASWIEDAKIVAAEDMGMLPTKFDYLEVDLNVKLSSLSLEDGFFVLWEEMVRNQEPSDMAKMRLALISLVGESRQRELIGKWNEILSG